MAMAMAEDGTGSPSLVEPLIQGSEAYRPSVRRDGRLLIIASQHKPVCFQTKETCNCPLLSLYLPIIFYGSFCIGWPHQILTFR